MKPNAEPIGRARSQEVVVVDRVLPVALAACTALLIACQQRSTTEVSSTTSLTELSASADATAPSPGTLLGSEPGAIRPPALHEVVEVVEGGPVASRGGSTALSTGPTPGPGQASVPRAPASAFGVNNPGGNGGVVLHVTSLAESGPGTLREALETFGPRIIVFDVAGTIDLGLLDLEVDAPFVTIDGHSGPAPGITLIRGTLLITTNNVRINDLRVRPGDAGQAPGSGWEPDGIAVWGPDAHDILIENCSVSWAVDENLSVSSFNPPTDAPHRVTIRNCISAEALRDSTHSLGQHSSGALIRGREVAVEGCLFAYNTRQNPVFLANATGIVVNNLIYDPEVAAVQESSGSIAVVGNALYHGLDTVANTRLLKGNGRAYVHWNLAQDVFGGHVTIFREHDFRVLPAPHLWRGPNYQPLPPSAVEAYVLMNAGAWPDQRDAIDQRIIDQVVQRIGNVIDSQDDVGGYPP